MSPHAVKQLKKYQQRQNLYIIFHPTRAVKI